ncbi:MAG: prephenate dehydrogenase/arogenate dehydrogenase family protein [Candidatus Omnitrophica bacterium]|nr:prephenate dehydrogenase/arogenate dehydrogenase family protein [Candidatus Omnitrophota bacterium]
MSKKKIKFKKVAIIGVGLIGGSIALALKKRKLTSEVIGFFRKQRSARNARKLKIVDAAAFSFKQAVYEADLIVLATPVGVIKESLARIINFAKPGAILMDVGSTKKEIVDLSSRLLSKKSIFFVGAHPLAGSDKSGLSFAKADMFKDSICFLTPTRKTNKAALGKVKKIWQSLGAKIIITDSRNHDRIVSMTSHLPHMISFALMNCLSYRDLSFSGNGLRDCTRLASSSEKIWRDICLSNKSEILGAIKRFKESLSLLARLLKTGRSRLLQAYFKKAKKRRDNL